MPRADAQRDGGGEPGGEQDHAGTGGRKRRKGGWPVAGQSITFDFLTTGVDRTAGGFRKVGDNTLLAAKGAKVLKDAIEKLGSKEDRTAAESALLAKALRQTGDAEDRVAARAVVADAAIRRVGDAMQDSSKHGDGLSRSLSGLKVNPGLLGPVLALAPAIATLGGVAAGAAAGLGGAFLAGGAAMAAFGAVAKPIMTDAKKAAEAVGKAQDTYNIAIANGTPPAKAFKAEQIAISKAYAGMSPQQIALSKQLGAMASSWDAVKTAETPVVAGAMQPWLKSVTDLTKNLAPIIAKIAPVIGYLGTKFDALVKSSAFKAFRDFIGSTGAAAVSAGGSTIIDLVKAFIILLPKFDPLIREAIGWISRLGPAVLTWASSKKTADHIQGFLRWFSQNGPVVGNLLKNIGGALKALAPGLAAGATAELNALSAFFGFVAKLPPSLAKPLAEVAGALLILNKLGVVKAGVSLVGWSFKGAAGGAAGGAAAGTEGGIMGGLLAKATPGVKWAIKGGLLIAAAKITLTVAASQAPKASPVQVKDFQKATPGGVRKFLDFFFGSDVNTASVAAYIKKLFGPTANWGPQQVFDWLRHAIAVQFDNIRHDIAHIWDVTWNNTVGRTERGLHDIAGWFDKGRHAIAHTWDVLTNDLAKSFDIFKNLVGIAWDDIKMTFFHGVRYILDIMGKLPGPLGAPFRTAARDIGNSMTGVQQDIHRRTGQIQADINSIHGKNVTVKVFASGGGGMTFTQKVASSISSGGFSLHSLAGGGLVRMGSGPTSDDVPAMLSRGELVVPAHMVKAGAADNLRGRIPGFAGGGLAGMTPWVASAETGFAQSAETAFLRAEQAQLKSAVHAAAKTASITAQHVPNVGSGVGRWAGTVRQALSMEGLSPNLVLAVLYQMLTESGGNPNAINLTDINAQHGDPSRGLMQVIGSTFRAYHWPGTSGNIYDPLANIAAALNYARHRYGPSLISGGMGVGSGHGYAEGGLVPGFASGGTVGKQGAAYLKAWRSRHGGGFGAAWGPVVVNQQIAEVNAAAQRARTLAGAGGLSAGQHKHWASAAAYETRRLGVLRKELGVERAWRGQLGAGEVTLGREIRAAGNLPSLAGNVRGWKAQLGRDKTTVGNISKMLGYSDAHLKAHPPAPHPGKHPPPGPKLPPVTHTYGGDVANNLGAVLSAALGPFTGAARGGMVMDSGGWLKPGWNPPSFNGTGRPEHLVPVGGRGAAVVIQVESSGSAFDQFMLAWLKKNAKIKGGGNVQVAFGSR